MKKRIKRGFILAETITVSVVVMTSLILIYTQFININRSYQNSFRYNTVDKLYAVNNVLSFLKTDNLQNLVNKLDSEYIDITSCQSEYIFEYLYCQNLISNLNIKQVIFTKEDTTNLKKIIKDDSSLSEEMKDFIKVLAIDKESDRYRLIVEFNDNTFASLKTDKFENKIVSNISNDCAKTGNTCTLDQIKTGVSMNVQVSGAESHKFYVLSDDGMTITLLMDRNLDIDGNGTPNDLIAWMSKVDYITAGGIDADYGNTGNNNRGPITALTALENKTNAWTNISNVTYSLTGTSNDNYNACYPYNTCTSNKYTIANRTARARLPRTQELVAIGCTDSDNCPTWVYDYLDDKPNPVSGVWGYWTSSAYTTDSNYAWLIISKGYLNNNYVYNDYNSGVRPVITISKNIIK